MNEKEIRISSFNIFLNYKRTKCQNMGCNYSDNFIELNLNCFNYHSKSDKRRFLFKVKDNKNLETFNANYLEELYLKFCHINNKNKNNLNYLELEYNEILIQNYFEFINKKNISKKDKIIIDKTNALNFLESNFHINNYKSQSCINKNTCINKYCYYYHNNIEKNCFNFIKNNLINQNNIFNNSLIKLKEIVNNINIISNKYSLRKTNNLNKDETKKEVKNEINPDSVKKKIDNKKFNFNEIRPNFNSSKKYFYNQIIDFNKDKNIIFLKHLDLKITINSICALLNDNGGKIYFGIKNNIIKGINLIRQQIDEFQINLDNLLRNFNPGIFIHLMKINFFEISTNEYYESVVINKFIVRISVKNVSYLNQIYLTNENILCILRNKKVFMVEKVKRIIDYIKSKIILNKIKGEYEKNNDKNNISLLLKKIDSLIVN